MSRIFEEIDRTRRRFLGTAGLSLAATELGLVRFATTQSKAHDLSAANPEAFFPGFSAEMVETSGTKIHVLRKGSARPLLLLHGYPETHLTWRKVAPKLAEQFSVVVALNKTPGAIGPDEMNEYIRAFSNDSTIHATYEDFRAAADIDLEMDQADDKAGRKIRCPVHALWGARATVGVLWDVIATWREKSAAPVTGKPLDCGHFLQEERPQDVTNELLHFLS
jgi:pimeloyl-ACP methyl ester carboxylesterase